MKKPLGQYGPAGVIDSTTGSEPPAAKDDDDDDLDLFGSDEVRPQGPGSGADGSNRFLPTEDVPLWSCRMMRRPRRSRRSVWLNTLPGRPKVSELGLTQDFRTSHAGCAELTCFHETQTTRRHDDAEKCGDPLVIVVGKNP